MTRRVVDALAATLTGMLAGVLLMAFATSGQGYFDNPRPTPRPSQHADPRSPRGMTTDGLVAVPSPDVAGRTGRPDALPAPTTGTRPASVQEPRTSTPPGQLATAAGAIRGVAVWYDYVPGHAAAGPLLRRALGPTWRGTVVRVCHGDRCTRAVLSDWCACAGGRRLVDLDVRTFARLADPSVGVIRVTVSWPVDVPAPPDTAKGDAP